jgi:3-oxoacyl-[acyl-carrier protein] reductase
MTEERPNVLVVLGPEGGVMKPVVENLALDCPMVRVYHRTVPTPSRNCVDIAGASEIPGAVSSLVKHGETPRVGMIGAAFARQKALFVNLDSNSISNMLATNISLYVEAASLLLPLMMRSKFGRFVYLSSFRAASPVRGTTLYSASKAFGETFMSGIGKEYGRFGISTVNIRMGYFSSGMMDDLDEEEQKKAKRTVAMNRFGTVNDLEKTIRFALETPYLNSGTIELNGGLNLG